MLYTTRIKNLTTFYPKLSRVWIKTDDPQVPLKSVWINESALQDSHRENRSGKREIKTAEVAEEHLLAA